MPLLRHPAPPRNARRLLPLLPLVALLAHPSPVRAELSGVVTDTDGQPVAGATVGAFLDGGPFTVTDGQGRYTLNLGPKAVLGAHKAGFALSGPRWIGTGNNSQSTAFTLFPACGDLLAGLQPEKTATATTWTLAKPTVSEVDVHWAVPPAAWHVEMTLDVTNENGGNPHPDTRVYYSSGESTPGSLKAGSDGYESGGERVAVVKTAPVVGVSRLAVVVTKEQPGHRAALASVQAFAPQPITMDDVRHAERVADGVQPVPEDPNAFWRWDATNDGKITRADAVELERDMGSEVHPLRVLVINQIPSIKSQGGKSIIEVMHWNDPHPQTVAHAGDMQLASHGYLRVQLLPQIDADEFPIQFNRHNPAQKHRYTEEEFLQAQKTNKWLPHNDKEDWGADYNDIIKEYDIVRRVDCGDVDEVWVQSFPGMEMWETSMAGPNAYWCNSEPIPSPADSINGTNGTRLFIVTAFNYQRETDVMIHDWGHRTESILGTKVYGGWDIKSQKTTFDRFTRYDKVTPGLSCVGDCHYPPNATKDYDYANETLVSSDGDDWLNYPHLTGARKLVNRDTWSGPMQLKNGKPDYQRNFLIWFFQRLPHVPGNGPDGKLANWWKYVADPNSQVESR